MKRISLITGLVIACVLITPVYTHVRQFDAQMMPGSMDLSLTIDFGNGTVLNYTGYTGYSAPNVYNYTVINFDVDARWAGNRVYIDAIDGVYQNETHGWQYWVNGNYATVAANLYTLKDGDFVLWNLTTSGFQSQTEPDSTALIGGVLITVGGLAFLALLYRRSIRR